MQSTTVVNMAAAREGMLIPSIPHTILSRVAEANLPAGRVVTRTDATTTRGCVLPDATGEITDGDCLGITIFDSNKPYVSATHEYEQYDAVPVLRSGQIWMMAEDACTEGNAVFVRFVAGGSEELGRVRSDADTADAVALPNAIFRSSAGAGELIKVELNLPGAIV
jgi:hypothetical protein